MGSELSVAVLPETEYDEWTDLVTRSPDGSIYNSVAYLDALCSAAGGRFRVVAIRKGEALRGGIALYERGEGGRRFVAPRLLLYYNGPVLERYDTRYPSRIRARRIRALSALLEWMEDEGFARITLKPTGTLRDVRPFLAHGWSARPSYTYIVRLDDIDETWARIEQNLRRLVPRCEEHGVTVTEDGDFDGFYDLHAETMNRKETATYLPRAAFRTYVERLRSRDLATLFNARGTDGAVLASTLVLTGPHDTAHTVCAAADEESLGLGVNAFLRWQTFQRLAESGYRRNDLTSAALNSVSRFKTQLGGDLELSFELDSPRTASYRVRASARHLYWRTRAAAGRLVRSLRGRG